MDAYFDGDHRDDAATLVIDSLNEEDEIAVKATPTGWSIRIPLYTREQIQLAEMICTFREGG
jgi:hypothetical protein